MDDIKQGYRETEEKTKEAWRKRDGEDLADKVGNLGDDIREGLGNAGDDVRRNMKPEDDLERTGRPIRDPDVTGHPTDPTRPA